MLPTLRGNRIRSLWNDPFEALQQLDTMFNRGWSDGGRTSELSASYPVDIREDADHVHIDAEMPGFKKEEIDLTLEAGTLTISGCRTPQQDPREGTQEHLTERRFCRVQRSFSLPTSVDENQVEATLTDGVLHIKLNKREEVKPRRIEVR
jgi:HSP20 family protein